MLQVTNVPRVNRAEVAIAQDTSMAVQRLI